MSSAPAAAEAARDASTRALHALGDARPALAVLFVAGYEDAAAAARAAREVLGDVTMVGGTGGGSVFSGATAAPRGVSVSLLGGDVEVVTRSAALSPSLLEAVPAAAHVAAAADEAAQRGLSHYTTIVFAPGVHVDGEALVAAVRKGAGARAQLAGALTGADDRTQPTYVVHDGELHADRCVVAGLFSRRPVGIAARHGLDVEGEPRVVTRAEGMYLLELDGRPALDVWLEEARASGAPVPAGHDDLVQWLADHHALGIVEPAHTSREGVTGRREIVARAPFALRPDGSVRLSASIAEGTVVRTLKTSRADMLRAAQEAAAAARAGVQVDEVSGALVLSCAGRGVILDAAAELAEIERALGAPMGGASVFGEIARNVRDLDAFFNTTVVVAAFPA